MNISEIVDELTQQRDRIVAAINALGGVRHAPRTAPSNGRKKRTMSAEVKRRLSIAAKARWAKAKKAGKNAL